MQFNKVPFSTLKHVVILMRPRLRKQFNKKQCHCLANFPTNYLKFSKNINKQVIESADDEFKNRNKDTQGLIVCSQLHNQSPALALAFALAWALGCVLICNSSLSFSHHLLKSAIYSDNCTPVQLTCQFNSDLYETLNLSSCATNQ